VKRKPFEQVVAEHGALVLRLCRALVGPVDADDAWSETFIAALRAYPDLRPGSNVAAWLTTIAHNKAVDHIRKAERAPRPVDSIGERPVDDGAFEPADSDLRVALDGLTEKQRRAVLYHHVAGLPYVEVAEILGCSETAARRSAADGIAKLRAVYQEGHDAT
jgi:RNA polymerase sigma factor (sigma-70 family)